MSPDSIFCSRSFLHRSAGLLFCVATLASWALLSEVVFSRADAQQPSLAGLVNEFLAAPDADRADDLLNQILRGQPDPSAVEAAIKTGPAYRAQRTGFQPSQPLDVRGRQYRYGLYVPAGYDPAQSYPLIVCLHGAGFTGDAYLERWQARLGDRYILACPTLMAGTWWTREASEVVLAALDQVRSLYHIDPDRIFLTGMSNGGIGVYLVGAHYAMRFAGLAPMASGLDDVLMPFLENLRTTPVYVIHGSRDEVMPVQLSRRIAEELTRLGYRFIYREHDRVHAMAGGHFFPREELPSLVQWFDSLRRDPFPRHVTLVRDATHLQPFGWVRIDATDRIAAFTDRLIDSHDPALVARDYARLEAKIAADNRVEVQTTKVRRYTLFLNRDLVDLAKPVTVVTNGRVSFQGTLTPSVETMLREVRHRRDPRMIFPVALTIAVDRAS